MKMRMKWKNAVVVAASIAAVAAFTPQANAAASRLEKQAQKTINAFKQKDASLAPLFQQSAGYAVFPNITEGALGIGASHGTGILYEKGEPVGEVTVTKATVGAQAGAQSFAELIFLQTPSIVQQFKEGNYQFSASVSATGAKSGAGSAVNYNQGVEVFTLNRGGLMAQAAVGGQKFSYQPFNAKGGSAAGQG
jgi:lipid-binding SYLF domain-containing protein